MTTFLHKLAHVVGVLAVLQIAAIAAPPTISIRTTGDSTTTQVLYSPNGLTMASLGSSGIGFWTAKTGTLRARWQVLNEFISQIVFQSDDTLVGVGRYTSQRANTDGVLLVSLDPRTGTERSRLLVSAKNAHDIVAYALSPDCKSVAIAHSNGPVEIWDVATTSLRATLPQDTVRAPLLKFSPDSTTLATLVRSRPTSTDSPKPPLVWDTQTGAPATSGDPSARPVELKDLPRLAEGPNGLKVFGDEEREDVQFGGRTMHGLRVVSMIPVFWNAKTGKISRGEKFTGALTSIVASGDGSLVAAGHGAAIVILSTETGATVATIPVGQGPTTLAFSPTSDTLAVGERDGTLAVYPVHAGMTPIWHLHGLSARLQAFALSPDGALAANAYADGGFVLWDLKRGRPIKALQIPANKIVALAWSPDGKTLATSEMRAVVTMSHVNSGESPANIRLWDVPAMTVRQAIPGTDPRSAWSALAFSPDSALLMGIHDYAAVRLRGSPASSDPAMLWDAQTGQVKQSVDGPFATLKAIAFAPVGGLLAISDANTFFLCDPPTFAIRPSNEPRYLGGFTTVAFSKDGTTLITGNGDGIIGFWPTRADTPITQQDIGNSFYYKDPKTHIRASEGGIASICVSPDGLTAASGGADKTIRLWTVATRNLAATLPPLQSQIVALAYAPNGLLIAACADGTMNVCDPATLSLRATLAVLPGDRLGSSLIAADTPTPQTIESIDVSWISWTPEGYYVASQRIDDIPDWQQDGKTIPLGPQRNSWNMASRVEKALTEPPHAGI